jgi:hypothetical protein
MGKFQEGNQYGYQKVGIEALDRKPIVVKVTTKVRTAFEGRSTDEIRSALEEIARQKQWLVD